MALVHRQGHEDLWDFEREGDLSSSEGLAPTRSSFIQTHGAGSPSRMATADLTPVRMGLRFFRRPKSDAQWTNSSVAIAGHSVRNTFIRSWRSPDRHSISIGFGHSEKLGNPEGSRIKLPRGGRLEPPLSNFVQNRFYHP